MPRCGADDLERFPAKHALGPDPGKTGPRSRERVKSKNPEPDSDSIGKALANLDPVEWKVLQSGQR
jgi:hypothetical protein